jgi:hypothetical protein
LITTFCLLTALIVIKKVLWDEVAIGLHWTEVRASTFCNQAIGILNFCLTILASFCDDQLHMNGSCIVSSRQTKRCSLTKIAIGDKPHLQLA